jgi:hypothetical protein
MLYFFEVFFWLCTILFFYHFFYITDANANYFSVMDNDIFEFPLKNQLVDDLDYLLQDLDD